MRTDPKRLIEQASNFKDVVTVEKSDTQLVELVRSGDIGAFDVLYDRHRAVARHVASVEVSNRADIDDVVADAFTSVLKSLTLGKGPDFFFRAYLLTAVRRTAYKANMLASRTLCTDMASVLDTAHYPQDMIESEFETVAVAEAFRSLPKRWQAILWYTDIEGMKPAELSAVLGLSPNAISALARRARAGLRQAYLQSHITKSLSRECDKYSSKLGSLALGKLGPHSAQRVRAHLEECPRCAASMFDLKDVQKTMRLVILPSMTGITSSTMLSIQPSVTGDSADTSGVIANLTPGELDVELDVSNFTPSHMNEIPNMANMSTPEPEILFKIMILSEAVFQSLL